MSVRFVTSFNYDGFLKYGEQMLNSVIKHWKEDLKLIVYTDHFPSEHLTKLPKSDIIEYRDLHEVGGYNAFVERMAVHDGTEGGASPYNYRLDAIRFCHKVYALTDAAMNIADTEIDGGWLVWLDADSTTRQSFSASTFLAEIVPNPSVEIMHLGRTDIDYSETGFLAFNMRYDTPGYLLADLLGCYEIDEVVAYREWTDAFIFTRLLKIYIAHGAKVHDLSPTCKGLTAFEQSPLNQYFTHHKGGRKDHLNEGETSADVNLPRYKQLTDLVEHYAAVYPYKQDEYHSYTIAETGTWNGGRAIQMADAAFKNVDRVFYYGFDLFEEATDETDTQEYNVKAHNSFEVVQKRLQEYSDSLPKDKIFDWKLVKGDTNFTLEKYSPMQPHFAFIDGGHSEETVLNDWKAFSDCPIVVLDDYYANSPEGKPHPEDILGVNRLIKKLGETKEEDERRLMVLPSQDNIHGGGTVHIAVVMNDPKQPPIPEHLTKVPITITPKDCVPKEYIIDNINQNLKIIKDWGSIQECGLNNEEVIVVSGGPFIDWDELKKHVDETGHKVVCVKHSYPMLLAHDIQPYACVILDPRPIEGTSTHGIVRKDLFKKVDKETLFLVASMTDPSVTLHLQKKKVKIKGWHAFSEAVISLTEKTRKGEINLDEGLSLPEDTTFVTGGTCAAMRAIGMFHVLGFRVFHMYGFDCTVGNMTKDMEHERLADGRPKYMKVESDGEHFWTTGELLAMAQDCEKLFQNKSIDMKIVLHKGTADSLVSSVYYNSPRFNQPYYGDILTNGKKQRQKKDDKRIAPKKNQCVCK
jgi:hypothetical protein|tara:strand:+ start:1635 stop:4049 length:2415 start_codon:yes stop_codon:yes gene_type:complete